MSEKPENAEEKSLAVQEGELQPHEKKVSELSESEIAVIRDTWAKGATDQEFNVYMGVCRHRNLNPFLGEVHFVKYGGQMAIVVGIYGLLKIAERSGSYVGRTPYYWCGEDGEWVDKWLPKGPPAAAKVGVYRKGNDAPIYSVATWKSYSKDQPGPWRDMPDRMLGKCALAQALREACPAVDGIYIAEEFGTTVDDLKRNPEVGQSPRAAANGSKPSPDDVCTFGKKFNGKKWADIPPYYLDYITSKVKDKPDVTARAQYEIDLRAGNIPTTVDENGEILDADVEDDAPNVEFLRTKIKQIALVAPAGVAEDIYARLGKPFEVEDPRVLENIFSELQKCCEEGNGQ